MNESDFMMGLIIGIIIGILIVVAVLASSKATYKQGQVDALTGKVKYELIQKPDSTKVWVFKKENSSESK